MITKDALKDWLSGKPNGREWLSEKLGVSKSTVDGWCSTRAIPKPQAIQIESLMNEQSSSATLVTIPFTPDEYARIEAAARVGNYSDIHDFARDALKGYARQLQEQELTLVAEPRPTWGGKKKRAS